MCGQLGPHHFERDPASVRSVGEVDDSHAAFAQPVRKRVQSDPAFLCHARIIAICPTRCHELGMTGADPRIAARCHPDGASQGVGVCEALRMETCSLPTVKTQLGRALKRLRVGSLFQTTGAE
ncbi:hypothetical protein GCM10022226_08210 [Sphaerisporangium flaviroseum]|uniref:HTH luxR-type domain-containing protein n=1 Tax=Sphaerisporangium flaviroseum TaxID=509199 RepID=A0ABP7HES4_9ACTN